MTTVSSGQTLSVTAGQTSTGVVVQSGGTLDVKSGGTAIGTIDSGFFAVSSGGVASGTVVSSGGDAYVYSAGSASGTVVSSGGFAEVLSGGADSGTTNSGFAIIDSGGVGRDTVVVGDGVEYTDGSAVSMVIGGRGREYIYSGGIASNTVVSSGGTEYANSGGIDNGTVVSAGGVEYVYSGGIASATVVSSGGHGEVQSGGTASGMVVVSGGAAELPLTSGYGQWSPSSASVIDGVTVQSGVIVSLDLYKGGSISGFVVLGGAAEDIYSSGFAYSTLVSSGGVEYVAGSGGVADFSVILSGGYEEVYTGGSTFGTVLSSGGVQYVDSGGVASDTVVSSGAYQEVESGGLASGTTVDSGGYEYVYSGGVASAATVESGGAVIVLNGSVASGTVVSGGGFAEVPLTSAFGQWSPNTANVIDGVTIQSGANVSLDIYQGGSISGFVVLGGGAENINSGGVASGTVVSSGGSENISSGGVDSGSVVVSAGFENIYSGGVASGTVVSGGGQEYVNSGGVASGAVVSSGGYEYVFSGATASGTVDSGGTEFVGNGGVAAGTVVSTGGFVELPLTSAYGQWSPSGTSVIDGVTISSGAIVSLDLYQGGSISGFVVLSGGSENISSGGVANGTVVSSGGAERVFSGGVASGIVINGSGAVVSLLGGAVDGAIVFSGGGGQLLIAGSTMPGNTISGFVSGDTIDLATVAFDSAGNANLVSSGSVQNQLQITEGGTTYDFQLDPSQSFAGEFFHLASDGSSGTLVTENTTPCYCRGTLILTGRGEVPVEDLAIGDRVVTLAGALRPIRWIGRRSYSGRFARRRTQILPVRIAAGALADGVPRRDLCLSPNHALYLEGVLIEMRDLVNGVSIVQADAVEAIEYFHLELDSHDVIVAEGAPAESFIDDDSRGLFHNAHEYRALFPDAAAVPARYCAPRRAEGVEVERARAAIARRAGLPASAETAALGPLRGHIDKVGRRRVCGWAQDAAHPERAVCLDIHAGGTLIGQIIANRYRADLAAAGLGSGRHGFELVAPAGLALVPGSVAVRRSFDGAKLTPSDQFARRLARATGE